MTETSRPGFPDDAFAGTAPFYRRYRPPYPATLADDLIGRTRVEAEDRLLDLACGPGRLTFALAPAFREATAIDQEPEMIDEAISEAARRGVTNVRWRIGKAEEHDSPAGAFALVTMGDAFHRLDQRTVLSRAAAWLRPRGAVAIIGSGGTLGERMVQRIVAPIAEKWTGVRPGAPIPGSGPTECERLLRQSGFEAVESFNFPQPYVWSVDSILGYLFSTSFSSKARLGVRAEAFAAELEQALLSSNPAGRFPEILQFGYTFGRKP